MLPSIKNYTFIEKIGQGSYGEVWLVKHKDVSHKKFVLKKISFMKSSDREREAARQECQLLKRLEHPNIVQYKDSFEENNSLYIAMVFCEGGDLYTRLKDRKGSLLSEKQIVEWLIQITMALSYIHERNILHRDLKTQNIFLSKSVIKIGDLGIAKQLESKHDMAETVIGTPYYMSPELFERKPYNFKSDIWSLGCVTYEMATLKHAFNARNYTALSYKILNGQTPDMPSKYSNDLTLLIQNMLHKVSEKRPSTRTILLNPYIRNHIQLFMEQSKSKMEKPCRHRKNSSSKNLPNESHKESNHSDHNSHDNKISDVSNVNDEELKIIAESTLKHNDQDEYDDNDDVIIVDSSNGSHSKESLNGSSKENNNDSRKSSKTDLEIEIQKGFMKPKDQVIIQSDKQKKNELQSKDFPVLNPVLQKRTPKETSDEKLLNKAARERRREKKREKGLGTYRFPNAINNSNLDGLNDQSNENDSNINRIRRRRKNSYNQNEDAPPLPELRQIDTVDYTQNDIVCVDVLQVVEKMNETLKINESFQNCKDSILVYKDQQKHVILEPIENEQETFERSQYMDKRYQIIRKEIMTKVGYENLSKCFEILRDLYLNHEEKMRQILGDSYDIYSGKIIWLKMVEEG